MKEKNVQGQDRKQPPVEDQYRGEEGHVRVRVETYFRGSQQVLKDVEFFRSLAVKAASK